MSVRTETREEQLTNQLEKLLSVLSWAILPERDWPEGASLTRVELEFLRSVMKQSYKTLGFTDDELKDYVWSKVIK